MALIKYQILNYYLKSKYLKMQGYQNQHLDNKERLIGDWVGQIRVIIYKTIYIFINKNDFI